MVKHPKFCKGFEGTLDDLCFAIGNMAYDKGSEFIEGLAEDFWRQAEVDLMNGKEDLSSQLYQVSESLYQVKNDLDLVWKICKPYMED